MLKQFDLERETLKQLQNFNGASLLDIEADDLHHYFSKYPADLHTIKSILKSFHKSEVWFQIEKEPFSLKVSATATKIEVERDIIDARKGFDVQFLPDLDLDQNLLHHLKQNENMGSSKLFPISLTTFPLAPSSLIPPVYGLSKKMIDQLKHKILEIKNWDIQDFEHELDQVKGENLSIYLKETCSAIFLDKSMMGWQSKTWHEVKGTKAKIKLESLILDIQTEVSEKINPSILDSTALRAGIGAAFEVRPDVVSLPDRLVDVDWNNAHWDAIKDKEVEVTFDECFRALSKYNISLASNIPKDPKPDDFLKLTIHGLNKIIPIFQSIPNFCLPSKVFNTRAHQQLLKELLSTAYALQADFYRGKNGVHSATLVGAKGIGKTTFLRLFTQLGNMLFPKVLLVYVNFENVMASSNILSSAPILSAIIQNLQDRGYMSPHHRGIKSHLEHLEQRLSSLGLKLMILVDEVDQIYLFKDSQVAIDTLCDLVSLGNQTSGCFATLLCSSSSVLPLLVTCNVDDEIRKEYPLVVGAPNLNGQKFSTKRIASPLPTDLQSVKEVTGSEDDEINRLIMFIAGSTTRSIQKLISSPISLTSLQFISPHESHQGWKTLNSHDGDVLQEILKALMGKNADLFLTLVPGLQIQDDFLIIPEKDNLFDISKRIREVAWEKELKPLPFQEVQELVGKTQKNGDSQHRDTLTVLLRLATRGWINLDHKLDLDLDVYPGSLLQIWQARLDRKRRDQFKQSLTETLKPYLSGVVTAGALGANLAKIVALVV